MEYPQYSRPEVWHGRQVPPVLLGGNHGRIRRWRRIKQLERTFANRPDLFAELDPAEMGEEEAWLYEAFVAGAEAARAQLVPKDPKDGDPQ